MRSQRKQEYEDSEVAKLRAKIWKGFRLKFKLTQERLAEEAGISRRTVQMIERVENNDGIKPHRITIINFNIVRNKYLEVNGLTDRDLGDMNADLRCNLEEKKCSRCGIVKIVNDDFASKISSPDKRESICKSCRRNEYLYRKLGVSLEWYEKTLDSQNGGCAICGSKTPFVSGKKGKFCVDHDHKCCPEGSGCPMCIRGLLCTTCNTRLALVENLGFSYPPFERYLLQFSGRIVDKLR